MVGTALAAAQLALILLWQWTAQKRDQGALPVSVEHRSELARDFTVERIGGEVRTVQARASRYQLVHFWATWCPPCRKELPALLEMSRSRGRGLQVWAVATDLDWVTIGRFFKEDVPTIVVRDRGSAATIFGVTELPDSYLIDPDGRIRARFMGAQNWASGDMAAILNDLMR